MNEVGIESFKYMDYFRSNLLKWGKTNLEDFFWRRTKNSFFVLISEIFLSRTRAENVEKVIENFLKKYPNPKSLAESSREDIANAMGNSGLQNQKSQNFKDMGMMIIDEFKGKIPDNYDDLVKLKGVGKYIANAFLCFHLNQKSRLVDGNFIRIFERFFDLKSNKKEKRDDPKFWELAESLLPDKNYRLYNYSVLDFSRLVCKPKNPQCKSCILSKRCCYFANSNKK